MTPKMILVKSGHAEGGGQSMWHTILGESLVHYTVWCGSSLPKDNSMIININAYTGGRRISMCSYCLQAM